MSLKKIISKAAVGALAVVGTAGMAGAQTPITSSFFTVPGDQKLEMIYEVPASAIIKVVPGSGINSAEGTVVIDGTTTTLGSPGGFTTKTDGNVGQFSVTANFPKWDVELSTTNGGQLKNGDKVLKGATGGSTTIEPLNLELSIGWITSGGPPATAGLTPLDLTGSATTPISFAEALAANGSNASLTIEGTIGSQQATPAALGNVGFKPTTTAGVVFFVNAGLGTSNPIEIRGNALGRYTEDLTFTLLAGY